LQAGKNIWLLVQSFLWHDWHALAPSFSKLHNQLHDRLLFEFQQDSIAHSWPTCQQCVLHPCSEMAAASEELARDNCSVSDEVVQLREDKASQAQNMDALQVQLRSVACFVPYMWCKLGALISVCKAAADSLLDAAIRAVLQAGLRPIAHVSRVSSCCMLSFWQDLQTALERQALSRTYLAHHELESQWLFWLWLLLSLLSAAYVLQDRVAKLQELYMRDLDQSKAITVHEGIQQSNLLQLATPEMLALSQPPADFHLEEDARSTRIVPALHEIEGLRRERKTLKDQVNNTRTAATTFWGCASSGKSAD